MTTRSGSGRLRRRLKTGAGTFTPTPYVPPSGTALDFSDANNSALIAAIGA